MSEIRMLLDEIRDLKRRLQALETRGEHPGFAASDVARLSVANTYAGVQTIPNTGLHLLDTNASHDLIIAPGSDLSADRTLTLTTGDANRTLTMTGNATVNQDVSTVGSPGFREITLQASVDTGTFTQTKLKLYNIYAGYPDVRNWGIGSDAYSYGDFGISVSNSIGGDPFTSGDIKLLIKSSGNVLIGTTTDSGYKLNVNGRGYFSDSTNASVRLHYTYSAGAGLDNWSTTSDYAGVQFYTSDPDWGGVVEAGAIALRVSDQFGRGSNIVFRTGFDASNPSTERMRINSSGNVLIGTTTDSGGKAQIDQSSTTAAIPALRLNQADISEGFIDFIGTSAASAAGPISSWTVATIAGYVRVEINGAARWMAFYNDPTS